MRDVREKVHCIIALVSLYGQQPSQWALDFHCFGQRPAQRALWDSLRGIQPEQVHPKYFIGHLPYLLVSLKLLPADREHDSEHLQ